METSFANHISETYQELLQRPGVVVHTYNPSTWEAETGCSQVQGQFGLHSEFKANLSYKVTPCLKTKQGKTKKQKQGLGM
jgi:hypothetical protein